MVWMGRNRGGAEDRRRRRAHHGASIRRSPWLSSTSAAVVLYLGARAARRRRSLSPGQAATRYTRKRRSPPPAVTPLPSTRKEIHAEEQIPSSSRHPCLPPPSPLPLPLLPPGDAQHVLGDEAAGVEGGARHAAENPLWFLHFQIPSKSFYYYVSTAAALNSDASCLVILPMMNVLMEKKDCIDEIACDDGRGDTVQNTPDIGPSIKSVATMQMDAAVVALSRELSKLHTGRASPGMLDHIVVETANVKVPLSRIAVVSALDSHTLAVMPYDPEELIFPSIDSYFDKLIGFVVRLPFTSTFWCLEDSG